MPSLIGLCSIHVHSSSSGNFYKSRHFLATEKDKYNGTWRAMTPVFAVVTATGEVSLLWMGSFKAANDDQYLKANDITVRISCTGKFSCRQGRQGVTDLPPCAPDIGFSSDPHTLSEENLEAMKEVMIEIDEALHGENPALGGKGRNVLVFCRHGCRRSAAVVGLYLMCKTMNRGQAVYDFLIALRAPICSGTLPLLDQVERRTPQIRDWLQPLQQGSGGKEYHGLP